MHQPIDDTFLDNPSPETVNTIFCQIRKFNIDKRERERESTRNYTYIIGFIHKCYKR